MFRLSKQQCDICIRMQFLSQEIWCPPIERSRVYSFPNLTLKYGTRVQLQMPIVILAITDSQSHECNDHIIDFSKYFRCCCEWQILFLYGHVRVLKFTLILLVTFHDFLLSINRSENEFLELLNIWCNG